jgi:PAS domain S-box-containing protein
MTDKPSYEELQQRVRELEIASEKLSIMEKFFNFSLDMLCVADFDGNFREINAAFENTLGYSREELLRTPFLEFVHPEDKMATLDAMKQLQIGDKVHHFENRYLCNDGSYKWLSWNSVSVVEDRIEYAVARDITEQKANQQKLTYQRDLFDSVLATVPASIFWKDRNSVFLGANEQFARDAGVQSTAEIIGKSDYDFSWTKEEADFYRQCDQKVMDTGEPMLDIEETQQQANGKEVTLVTNKVPIRDASGRIYGMLGVYMDITKRKQAEMALTLSEQLFRTVFNSSNQFVGILNPEGMLLDANQAALDAVGLKKEDVVGRPFWDIYCWSYSADVQGRVKDAIRNASHGELVHYVENLLFRGDEIRTIDNTFKPVVSEQGETILIIPEGWDITEIRKAEEERQQHQLEMSHIARLSIAGEMAAGMAHELNQPLTAIMSYCEAAASLVKSPAPSPKQLCEVLEESVKQAHRASDIIKNFRNLVSKSDNQIELLDLDETIRDILLLLKIEVQKNNVLVEHYPSSLPCKAMANKIQIQQVLINMVWNSIEAIKNAKITEGRVVLRTRLLPSSSIEVTVTDNGPGIDAEIADKLFFPFQTSKHSGMGIGLSLSRRIIENHGGRLWVDRDYRNGALFGFELPTNA